MIEQLLADIKRDILDCADAIYEDVEVEFRLRDLARHIGSDLERIKLGLVKAA